MYKKTKTILATIALTFIAFGGQTTAAGVPSVSSATASMSSGTGVQGYAAASELQNGVIVQLSAPGSNAVQPATKKQVGKMYGVTVDQNNLPVVVSNPGVQNEVYVATTGTYRALVSTEAGAIKAGDYITMSSIDGIGMNAKDNQVTVFGRASQGFDGKGANLGTTTLKKSDGSTVTVSLGLVPVAIQIETNPEVESTKVNLPKPLIKLGQAIADKPVGPLRMYMSITIALVSIIISITSLYAGVRNSMISLGRSPLSRGAILRGLITVILTGLIILIVGFFAVYLLLKL